MAPFISSLSDRLPETQQLLLGAALAAALAMALLLLMAQAAALRERRRRQARMQDAERAVFLFEGRRLLDASPEAERYLQATDSARDDPWGALVPALERRFPGLSGRLAGLGTEDGFALDAADPWSGRLEVAASLGLVRLTLTEAEHAEPDRSDRLVRAAMEDELSLLRAVAEDSPCLVWSQDAEGRIRWANAAYLDLAAELATRDSPETWPPRHLFEDVARGPVPEGGLRRRMAVRPPSGAPRWFETTTTARGSETLHFAVPADETVRAEIAQRNFVQTLSKTFASLSTGLMIFDRARRLALFNPALADLTGLPAEFLAGRPTLHMVLDRMRETRMIPEPKDYSGWRAQIAALEASASGNGYREDWSLPTGQTFRVTGRPHPDGALAFLLEDVSAELLLTRRFRAQGDLYKAVLDAQAEALLVVSPGGTVTTANAAYVSLWGTDPSTSFIDLTVIDTLRQWQAVADPAMDWTEIRRVLAAAPGRREWSGEVRLADGRTLPCRLTPLSGGGTLVAFMPLSAPAHRLAPQARPASAVRPATAPVPAEVAGPIADSSRAPAAAPTVATPGARRPALRGVISGEVLLPGEP